MEFIGGTSETLPGELMEGIARYRHRVFVETLGWSLPCCGQRELDQFDRADTWHVAARAGDGRLVGIGRLLPTDRPYLLGEVFPQLMGAEPLPRQPDIWELSRFAAVDFEVARTRPRTQFSSSATAALLQATLRLAASQGVARLITVSPLGVERLLRRLGVKACRAGSPQLVEGRLLFACWIDVPPPAGQGGACCARPAYRAPLVDAARADG